MKKVLVMISCCVEIKEILTSVQTVVLNKSARKTPKGVFKVTFMKMFFVRQITIQSKVLQIVLFHIVKNILKIDLTLTLM